MQRVHKDVLPGFLPDHAEGAPSRWPLDGEYAWHLLPERPTGRAGWMALPCPPGLPEAARGE